MAMSESIKRRIRILEDECAWAENLAACIVEVAGNDPSTMNRLAFQFQHTVDALRARASSLITALNREARDVEHG